MYYSCLLNLKPGGLPSRPEGETPQPTVTAEIVRIESRCLTLERLLTNSIHVYIFKYFFKNLAPATGLVWEHGTPPGIPGGFKGAGQLIAWARALVYMCTSSQVVQPDYLESALRSIIQ